MARRLERNEAKVVGQRIEIRGRTAAAANPRSSWPSMMVRAAGEVHFTALVRDITEKKAAERELREAHDALENEPALLAAHVEKRTRELRETNQELVRISQTKDDFLANMSHEIRTPMNATIGLAHLALETELDDQQRDYIGKLHLSAEGRLGILNDILDFSKIESDRLEMEELVFLLEDVMDQLRNIVGIKAEDKGLRLSIDVADEVAPGLIGDPLRLGQILVNLGNNAVKFTNTGGSVAIHVRSRPLRFSADSGFFERAPGATKNVALPGRHPAGLNRASLRCSP